MDAGRPKIKCMLSRYGIPRLRESDAELELSMLRAITNFSRDEEGHWRAELECGHAIHVRHDPPWTIREWVLDSAERAQRVGTLLDCKRCDEGGAAHFG